MDKKSNKNFLIYYVGGVTPNSLKPFHLMINPNRFIEESNWNKYFALISSCESKYKPKSVKKYEKNIYFTW